MTSQAGQDIRGGLWHIVEMVGEEALEHHDAGELDELTVGSWLRAEWMEGRTWWLRIGDARIVVNTEPDGRTCVDVQRGFYDEVRGTTTTHHETVSHHAAGRRSGAMGVSSARPGRRGTRD